MPEQIPNSGTYRTRSFKLLANTFLAPEGLPFACIISAERIQRIFQKHRSCFGENGVYSTAVMLWAFLSQVLRDGKEASCQAAVARVVTHCQVHGMKPPTEDTGDYCRARRKLSVDALQELSCDVADQQQREAPKEWLWKGKHHAKLVDGFTFSMPDTAENQAAYPQMKAQKPGLGTPISRAVAIVSLATACVMNLSMTSYQGKETGESALLRKMLKSFHPGDIVVMDRYYCSYMLLAMLQIQGAHVCARKHQYRRSDFRKGKRLGRNDHLIVWTRPNRPKWMSLELYETIPETMVLREVQFTIQVPGRRTDSFYMITTLTDAAEYTVQDIADLYGYRWHSELDIRSIKSNLNLGHVRCKSPEMVHREVWTTILGYNLIRMISAGAAQFHNKHPRQISFTSTCQILLAFWPYLSSTLIPRLTIEKILQTIMEQLSTRIVGNRPNRQEPRVIKRRRDKYKLMMKPRDELRRELRKQCT